MKDESRAKLDVLLSQEAARKKEAADKERAKLAEMDRNVETFRKLADSVIRPVLEEFKDVLNKQGRQTYIRVDGDKSTSGQGSKLREAKIALVFGMGGPYDDGPQIIFWCGGFDSLHVRYEGKISSATHQGHKLSAITKDLVETEVLTFVEKVLNGRSH